MKSSSFIDTNIWVYAFLDNERDHSKQTKIVASLERISGKGPIVSSVQVVNEFHWILTRKYGIDEATIKSKVTKGIASLAPIAPIDYTIYQNSFRLRGKYTFSFWDSLIVASALENKCALLYSEDMQHGLVVENKLKILNPLAE